MTTDVSRVEGAETARRALRILELVAASERPAGLDELVRRTQLTKSTVYRLLRTLVDEEYVERVEGGGYVGGRRLLALAAAAMPEAPSYERCQPLLQRLAEESGETATLHRRAGDHAVLVLGAESAEHPLRRVATLGETTPLVRGSAGLAILGGLPAAVVDELLEPLPPADAGKVRRSLTDARRRGVTVSYGSNHPGVNGVAAAVPGRELSVAVSGPESRWTRARLTAFAPRLVAAAAEASTLLR